MCKLSDEPIKKKFKFRMRMEQTTDRGPYFTEEETNEPQEDEIQITDEWTRRMEEIWANTIANYQM
jgi:hypothetical protein